MNANNLLRRIAGHLSSVLVFFSMGQGQLNPALFEWDGAVETAPQSLPAKFSGLGFDPARTDLFIPYTVNIPQFRHFTKADRYVYVPKDSAIVPDDSLYYDFPIGTVFFRLVYVDTALGNPATRKKIEMQIQLRTKYDQWGRALYLYDDAGSDATLVPMKTEIVKKVDITNAGSLGYREKGASAATGLEKITVAMKRRGSICYFCHYENSANGFITQQLNKGNQLNELVAKGVLASLPPMSSPTLITSWSPLSDPQASAWHKAHSYLAGNCSHCHSHDRDRVVSGEESIFDFFSNSPDSVINNTLLPGDPANSGLVSRILEGRCPPDEMDGIPDIATAKFFWNWTNELGNTQVPFPGIELTGINKQPHKRRAADWNVQFHNRYLVFSGLFSSLHNPDVSLFDILGNAMQMHKIDRRSYLIEQPIHPGIYLIRVDDRVVRAYSFTK
jgi:hypothetical protein